MIWQAWYWQERFNRPDLGTYQLMQIARRIEQTRAKNPQQVKLEHQRVTVERKIKKDVPDHQMTADEATAISKFRWGMAMGRTQSGNTRE